MNVNKIILIILSVLIVSSGGILLWYNYDLKQQQIAAEEQARIEQAKIEEENRIAKLNEQKTILLDSIGNILETYGDYIGNDESAEVDNIIEYIKSCDNIENIDKYSERLQEIVDNAIIYKEYLEQYQSNYENNYQYYSYDIDSFDAKEWIAQRESGGDYSALNGRYWGRYQLSNDWFNGYDRDFILNTEEGHKIQEEKIEEYVAGRYGSWENAYNFWQNNGWY